MFRLPARQAMALAAAAVLATGCGKKGPPLAPITRLPAAVETLTAARVGNDVFLTVTIPAENIDGTAPVDISRVDVFGYTGTTPPPRGRFTEQATLVGSIPVIHPPAAEGAASPTPAAPDPAAPAFVGSMATIVDHLDADELTARSPAVETPGPVSAPQTGAPRPVPPLRRYYVAIGMSTRGRAGGQGDPVDVGLTPLPPPPSGLTLTNTATTIELAWQPVGDAQYNVYLVTRPSPVPVSAPAPEPQADPAPPVAEAWAASKPVPLNGSPLSQPRFSDPGVAFGSERCYVVRAVSATPPQLEGEASAERCITAADTYPPAAPSGLIAVGAQGLISLIWEVNSDSDLAGYMVLRGTPGDATLQPLTPAPITEARFTDTTVQAGTTYVYAVVAVDTAGNRSAASARVEEVGR